MFCFKDLILNYSPSNSMKCFEHTQILSVQRSITALPLKSGFCSPIGFWVWVYEEAHKQIGGADICCRLEAEGNEPKGFSFRRTREKRNIFLLALQVQKCWSCEVREAKPNKFLRNHAEKPYRANCVFTTRLDRVFLDARAQNRKNVVSREDRCSQCLPPKGNLRALACSPTHNLGDLTRIWNLS